jgi:pyruvate dehydrogenase phosphatase
VCGGVWPTSSTPRAAVSSGDDSKGCDGLLWWHDLVRCHVGNVSVTIAQANLVLEDIFS